MASRKSTGRRLDFGSVAGLLVAIGGIMGGFLLEHGKPHQMLGTSAALIVFGGCLGATLVASPLHLVRQAFMRLRDVFFEPSGDHAELLDSLVRYSTKARKDGLVSLEQDAMRIEDPFLRKALTLAIDGADLQEIRSMMDLEIELAEQNSEKEARVFEVAGGYAPTIGIIGAVLGLIIVMGNIDDIKKVGEGIAAAFVATIYGVGSANIFFLPAANKLKLRARAERERRELILEGVISIVEGMNPKLIRIKLEAFTGANTNADVREAA